MQLALGRKEAYSVEIVMHLAEAPPGVLTKAREVASAVRVPPRYLPQILADLVRARILIAKAGREGGYRLARDAAEITLLDVVEAAGAVIEDEDRRDGRDPRSARTSALAHEWSGVRHRLSLELRGTRITDLNAAVRALASEASPAS